MRLAPHLATQYRYSTSFAATFSRLFYQGPFPPRARKGEFMESHVDAATTKSHALSFQPQALLQGSVSAKFDCASGSHDSLPRKVKRTAQNSNHLSGSTRISCSFRDRSVGGHMPPGNGTNRFYNFFAHGCHSSTHGIGFSDSREGTAGYSFKPCQTVQYAEHRASRGYMAASKMVQGAGVLYSNF
jgi:hypothetical protein